MRIPPDSLGASQTTTTREVAVTKDLDKFQLLVQAQMPLLRPEEISLIHPYPYHWGEFSYRDIQSIPVLLGHRKKHKVMLGLRGICPQCYIGTK